MIPKGLLAFLGFFYAMWSLVPCWALPEYIQALIDLACLRVFLVTPWVIVYRLYRGDDMDKVLGFKRSHWTHLG